MVPDFGDFLRHDTETEPQMKAGLGLVGIVVALAIVGVLVQKSLKGPSTAAANAAAAAGRISGQTVSISVNPQANVAEQSRQLQAQIKAQVEAAQAPQREAPDAAP
jgi:hypothetical protein